MFLDGGSRRGREVGVASLGGEDNLLGLCEVALDCLVTGWEILGSIGVGKSWPGGEVADFDGDLPSGFDWKACGGVEVAHKGANDREVMGVEGSRVCRSSGMDWCMGDGMILRAEREAPNFSAGGVSPSFE